MAEAEMARIADEARSRWAAEVSLAHRVGRLEVGEIAVAIAVSTPHRAAAFEACRHVIEEVKRRVPIWKKELFADGSTEWVDPSVSRASVI
jgi:molybdopterin synthase catalytic subunit